MSYGIIKSIKYNIREDVDEKEFQIEINTKNEIIYIIFEGKSIYFKDLINLDKICEIDRCPELIEVKGDYEAGFYSMATISNFLFIKTSLGEEKISTYDNEVIVKIRKK